MWTGYIFLAVAGIVLWLLLNSWLRLRRAEFIRTYEWPPGLLDKLSESYPEINRKDAALVSRGLRQFFVAYLMSGKRFVSMPSRVADDLWHEFILYTREYQRFCRRAFGTFMHHTPAMVLSENRKSNAGLRRVWWYCCKYENIDARNPTRLPLRARQQAEHPERLRLSSALRSAARRRHCGCVLRRRFLELVVRWRHRWLWRRRRRFQRAWGRRRRL